MAAEGSSQKSSSTRGGSNDPSITGIIARDSCDTSTPPTQVSESRGETQEEEEYVEEESSKLRSSVWQHFNRLQVNGEWKAKCHYCFKLLGGNTRNGTKHLHCHLQRCKRKGVTDLRQTILTNNLSKGNGKELKVGMFDQENSRTELAKMIIMHEYPLSMVEHLGFRRFANSLQPLFKVPSRNTIKSDILKIYDFEKVKTMKLLEKNEGKVAITTDMWTSNQKRGFMAITSHFIDSSWTLQSRILRYISSFYILIFYKFDLIYVVSEHGVTLH